MATQDATAAGPELPGGRVTERRGPVLARPAHAGAGHRPADGRGGACRAGRSPESRRRRGADSALRPGLYRQRPRTARAHRRRARAGARRPAVRPLPRHHPRAWPAVGEPVHQPHRGLHPDPQPGISAGQGQRRRRQPDRDRRRGRLAGRRHRQRRLLRRRLHPVRHHPDRDRRPAHRLQLPLRQPGQRRAVTARQRRRDHRAGCPPSSPTGSRQPACTSSSPA